MAGRPVREHHSSKLYTAVRCKGIEQRLPPERFRAIRERAGACPPVPGRTAARQGCPRRVPYKPYKPQPLVDLNAPTF